MPEENKAESLSTEMTGATRSAETARALIRKTKRATRRRFPTEDKIRIVIEGVRGEISVAELCRREGIHPTIYYNWLKDFMEACKTRMRGDTEREATTAGLIFHARKLGRYWIVSVALRVVERYVPEIVEDVP